MFYYFIYSILFYILWVVQVAQYTLHNDVQYELYIV